MFEVFLKEVNRRLQLSIGMSSKIILLFFVSQRNLYILREKTNSLYLYSTFTYLVSDFQQFIFIPQFFLTSFNLLIIIAISFSLLQLHLDLFQPSCFLNVVPLVIIILFLNLSQLLLSTFPLLPFILEAFAQTFLLFLILSQKLLYVTQLLGLYLIVHALFNLFSVPAFRNFQLSLQVIIE